MSVASSCFVFLIDQMFRHEEVNQFHTVLVQFLDNQTDAAFCREFIADFRKTIQMFDQETAEGVEILGFQHCFRMLVQFQTVI